MGLAEFTMGHRPEHALQRIMMNFRYQSKVKEFGTTSFSYPQLERRNDVNMNFAFNSDAILVIANNKPLILND